MKKMMLKIRVWMAFVVLFLALTTAVAWAGNHPIIFVHGTKGNLGQWNPAIQRILSDYYGGFYPGNPLSCTENTQLVQTNNPKSIYNFYFYHVNSNPGAIGSNGVLVPKNPYVAQEYQNNISGGTWATSLAAFIDKVLVATGASQVDIVTHSMGALVARSAIKYYGCSSKVHKILMVAAINHPVTGIYPYVYNLQPTQPLWMASGENLEMGIPQEVLEVRFEIFPTPHLEFTYGGIRDATFKEGTNEGKWIDFLNNDWRRGAPIQFATIAGNRNPLLLGIGNDDQMVNQGWVSLDGADFNAINIYASHANSSPRYLFSKGASGEYSLTDCTFTTEFIKNWIIDDVVRRGAHHIEPLTFYPSPWGWGEGRVESGVNGYENTLALQAELYTMISRELVGVKGWPLYKYTKRWVDPIWEICPNWAGVTWGLYGIQGYTYDMTGLVESDTKEGINIIPTDPPLPAAVGVRYPTSGEQYSPGDPIYIQWWRIFHACPKQEVFFTSDGGRIWTSIVTLPWEREANGTLADYYWTLPSNVSSGQCQIKVVAELAPGISVTGYSGIFSVFPPRQLVLHQPTYVPCDFGPSTPCGVSLWWSWEPNNPPLPEIPDGWTILRHSNTAGWFPIMRNWPNEAYRVPIIIPVGHSEGFRIEGKDQDNSMHYSNEGWVTYNPGGGGDPLIRNTTDSSSTGYPNGQKVVLDKKGRLHVVFTSSDTVYYSISDKKNKHWSTPKAIGLGKFPAIALDSHDSPHVLWTSGTQVLSSQLSNGNWTTPYSLFSSSGATVEAPSFVINTANDSGFASWTVVTTTSSEVSLASFMPGDTTAPVSIQRVDSGGSTSFASPSLTLDPTGKVLVSWSRDGEVYFQERGGSILNLSNTPGALSIHPVVDAFGDRVCVTWQEEDSTGAFKTRRVMKVDDVWISLPDFDFQSGNSLFPSVAGASQMVYSSDALGQRDIYYRGEYQNGGAVYGAALTDSVVGLSHTYPSISLENDWPNATLHVVWTAGGRYPIKVKSISFEVPPVPLLFVDPGKATPSSHTLQRTAIVSYGSQPYLTADVHREKLIYRFTNLNPDKRYRLGATYYFEKPGETWRMRLKVDGWDGMRTRISSGERVDDSNWIPASVYQDGVIDVEILPLEGDFALCNELALYEFTRGSGGPQEEEGWSDTPLPLAYALGQSFPNPCRDKTTISYQLPEETPVSLKVYNVAGQVVRELASGKQKAGYYQAAWDGKDGSGRQVSSGVYFYRLDAGGFSKTNKLVVVR